MAQMNVVPYIDVMLVLLVIFMVTAPMMQTGVQVDLPDADADPIESNNQEEPITISVDQQGVYYLDDGSEASLAEVTDYVHQKISTETERKKQPVYVQAAENVEYTYVMQAMVAIQKAGASSIGLMADPVPEESQR